MGHKVSPLAFRIGYIKTFSINDDKKTDLINSFSMFICTELTDDELQKLIVLENNIVYYHEADPNDENLLNDDGDKIIFEDMIHYTMVKTTTFNGIKLPSIVIKHDENNYQIIKNFGYNDYKMRLS